MAVDHPGLDLRDHLVARDVARVQGLRRAIRQLQRNVWRHRRGDGADALVLSVGASGPRRRRDERGDRARVAGREESRRAREGRVPLAAVAGPHPTSHGPSRSRDAIAAGDIISAMRLAVGLRIADWGLPIALLVGVGALAAPSTHGAQDRVANDVLVFAAASLKEVLDEIVAAAQPSIDGTIRVSYAASSALARQIEAGAPAHLFISADTEWMDYLAGQNLIQSATRVDLVGNSLVLIAPAAEPVRLKIEKGFGLAAALGSGRLAVADPAAVPAGKYARAALKSLGVWNSIADRLAPADNVRSALALVARGEAPLGIVYRTDALVEPKVRIVDAFPKD